MNAEVLPPSTIAARAGVFRHSPRDAALVVIASAHALAFIAFIGMLTLMPLSIPAALASAAFVGVGIWWSSNTVSHNHLHNPIFVGRRANQAFSFVLSIVLGVPQTIWKQRHLWHHAGEPSTGPRLRLGASGIVECAGVIATWLALVAFVPNFALYAYLPGWALGMFLCFLQGHFEHRSGETSPPDLRVGISHYGTLYNRLWLNDGFHAEHHLRPSAHWTTLPSLRTRAKATPGARESAFPPVLRFLEGARAALQLGIAHLLGGLERLPLSSSFIRKFVVEAHVRAFARVLPKLGQERIHRICIVGGGLFPRTVLVMQRLLPGRRLVVIDASAPNLAIAKRELERESALDGVELRHARFDGDREGASDETDETDETGECEFDLVIVPLAFVGKRTAVTHARTLTLVHDWSWRRTGEGTSIAWWLLKRLNVVRPASERPR